MIAEPKIQCSRNLSDVGGTAKEAPQSEKVSDLRSEFLLLVLLIGAAVWIRLDFMSATLWSIDADEAIVGLMGKHILEGRGIPVFYYGQHYMGSLEAILASISFYFFGVTPFALSLVPLLCGVLLGPLMYCLAAALAGPVAGRVAALLMAVPPSALVIWSTKARGGFVEILVLGAIALLVTIRWFQGSSTRLGFPVVLGFVLGLGWWVNNQIVYFIVPIGICSVLVLGRDLLGSSIRLSRLAAVVGAGLLAFGVGSCPYWLYNFERGFPSLGMFAFAPADEIGKQASGLFYQAIPILLGAVRFWHTEEIFPHAIAAAYAIYLVLLVVLLIARRKEVAQLFFGRINRASPVELLPLVVVWSCFVFTVSTFGWLVQAPRYLLPIYVSLFALVGVAVSLLARHSKAAGTLAVCSVLGMNISSSYLGGRAVAGEPIVFKGERVARDHTELIAALDELGISYVRANYWIGYRLAFETAERITFSMFQEPYQIRIPEYERGLTPAQRQELPLVLVPSEGELVRRALQEAGIPFKERQAGGYVIVYDIRRPMLQGKAIPPMEIEKATAFGERPPQQAFDGDVTTRWGTGMAQRPGMTFEVTFKAPVMLSGVEYDIGLWPHDYPRGLQIDVILSGGRRETVLGSEEYASVRYLYQMNGALRFDFPAREAQGVVLTQTGSDPRLDWSIGELHFFTPESK